MDMPRKYVYTYYYVVPAATFTLNKSRSTLLNKRGNVIYLCRKSGRKPNAYVFIIYQKVPVICHSCQ